MEQAIGVIDSGVGGLTVVHELMRQLPKEPLIYVGDTARCPYGPRTEEEVKQYTWEMVRFLLKKNIKMLVIACNTATAFTIKDLKEKLDIPVIGVIKPGARAAIKSTENNHVGIIGTEGTIRSGAYRHALRKIKPDIEVISLACPSLAPMVEKGILDGPEARQVVETALTPLLEHDAMDTLILGCTHYPLLKKTIQEVMGEKITVISSSEETARETSTTLDIHQNFNYNDSIPPHQFYTTGDLEKFIEITQKIFRDSNFEMLTIKHADLT
ncbi:glutamate racemase [Oceanobacillus sp. J11TS1]|uniref:glutamate racemase n=1 Tax=Oceanobacillus sp. J11TS1 TaxID=2807191 RepID=UPI001B1370AA|nr:glutamate racemase [Oceanobacillus sp. J11TS1]GIO21760.1 glutamate racemase 1 [Oceanobacillus sp. J11TS1]